MAELASAYPTSGGMYYWQYKLAGRRVGPFACWITGECGGVRDFYRV
jgi:amino acid transporter